MEALLALAADDPQTLFSSSATPTAVEASVGDVENGIALNVGGIASGFSGATASGQPIRVGVPFRFALSWHREGILAAHDGVVFVNHSGEPHGPVRIWRWGANCATVRPGFCTGGSGAAPSFPNV